MLRHFKIFFLTVICFLLAGWGQHAEAKTIVKTKPSFRYTRIFYYQEGKNARASFTSHLKTIDVLAPQTYFVDATGTLVGSVNPDILSLAKKNKIKVMPLLVNKSFSRSVAASIMSDPIMQDNLAIALVNEAEKYGYWGWQIDFEQVDASYRDAFTLFTQKCRDALAQRGLVLSVAVVAQVSQDPSDYKPNLWQNLIGVYDFAALASNSDFVSLMSYDDPESKGPVARYSWLKQVVDYALKFIPAEKLSMGIPLYYWRWNDTLGKHVGTGGYTQLVSQANAHYVKRGYSTVEQTAYMRYTSKKMNYTIWYENEQSIRKKVELITKNHLHGFSAWALGLEVPTIYRAVVLD